jgi:hypothetical protein
MNTFAPLQLALRMQQVGRETIWRSWLVILGIVFGIHLTTLTISPTVWIDEVNVVEHGRIILNPSTDWSILWAGKPLYLITYLGAVFQEIGFQLTHSMVGPRISSILGGLLAGTFTLAYLQTRQIPRGISLALASLFLLEPMFVQSYRGARVDSWAIAFCMGSCWLFSLAGHRLQQGKSATPWVLLAGGFAAASQFIWLSSPMLFPLILVEGIGLLQVSRSLQQRSAQGLRLAVLALLGWAGTTMLLLLPILPHLTEALQGFQLLATINQTLRERGNLISELNLLIRDIVATFKFDPFLLILFGAGLVFARDRKLVLVSLFVIFLTVSTKVYALRCIYLLPYLMCVVGDVFKPLPRLSQASRQKRQKLVAGILALTLLWCLVFSLLLRPANALKQSQVRDPAILQQAGLALIGKGPHSVYLSDPDLYYVGRSLGWKMYNFIGVDFGQYVPKNAVSTQGPASSFPKLEAVLTAPKTLQHPSCAVTVCQLIDRLDYQKQDVFQNPLLPPQAEHQTASDLGAQPYQSFILYRPAGASPR